MDMLERTLTLLEVVIDKGGLTFAGADRALDGVPPSTLSRLLKRLCTLGMLKHDEGVYLLGDKFNKLAVRAMKLLPWDELLRPVLRDLAVCTGQSSAFFLRAPGGGVLLAKHEMPDAFHYIAEGDINRNMGRSGFLRVLYLPDQPSVQVIMNDDNALLRRVISPVRLPDGGIGAIGISMYTADISDENKLLYQEHCLRCAHEAENILRSVTHGVIWTEALI